MMVRQIKNEQEFETIKNGDKPMLVDFYATWCGPCKVLAPILEQVASELGDGAAITKVDVDELPGLAKSFGIMSVPTVYVFRKGKEIIHFSGLRTKAQIVDILRKA